MALTSDVIWADNSDGIPKPDGYTPPTTAIEQTGVILDLGPFTHSMTASNGVSTTPTLGMDALQTAIETFLATYITTVLGIDTATDTVTAIARISKIVVGDHPADIYENDATRKFEITFRTTITVV